MPAPSNIPIPKEWPPEVRKSYEPVRVLGEGGFASVILARQKENKTNASSSLVAIKICSGTSNNLAYTHREVDILRELNHPNIMKVIDSWEPKNQSKFEPSIIALSYAKGPTVRALLKHGGALSTVFSRVVIAQLVDAISYLHSHAVVHRDIKPDSAVSKDDSVWDNVLEDEEAATAAGEKKTTEEYWEQMRNKWKMTLIDFGFARALTPEDVQNPSLEVKRENLNASYHAKYNLDLSMSSGNNRRKQRPSVFRKTHAADSDDGSTTGDSVGRISRHMRRVMSTVGNAEFAAPEIQTEMHHEDHDDPVKITDTIGQTVSEYGLLVDAYSLGCTLRYMMTGCLPRIRVQDAIADQNSLCFKLLSACCGSGKKRKVRFRLEEELPGEAQRLMSKMMEKAEKNRTSVRTARLYPWIADVLPESSTGSGKKIDYLQVVLDASNTDVIEA
eukprot:scaffold4902_cov115-Cylindrotheca_fusiformis.AAC.13